MRVCVCELSELIDREEDTVLLLYNYEKEGQ